MKTKYVLQTSTLLALPLSVAGIWLYSHLGVLGYITWITLLETLVTASVVALVVMFAAGLYMLAYGN